MVRHAAANGVRAAFIVACAALILPGCASKRPEQTRTDDSDCRYLKPDHSEPGLRRNFPRTEDYRPRGESGRTVMNICVAADGRLVGEPTVVKSSGNERIDRAAVAMLSAGSYCPAMQSGTAVERCFKMLIKMGPDSGP